MNRLCQGTFLLTDEESLGLILKEYILCKLPVQTHVEHARYHEFLAYSALFLAIIGLNLFQVCLSFAKISQTRD